MMTFKKYWFRIIKISIVFFPLSAHASFIETTIGTAVVNDATASYYNPAALVLMKNSQIIPQGTVAYFRTRFSGQSTTVATGLTETGSTNTSTRYFSPSLYLGIPITDIVVGLAIVSNSANREADENSILRYVQAKNNIRDVDIVPALAIKLSECFSIGAGVNFSYANFDLQPITRFPGSNLPDGQSHNTSDGNGVGGNAGFLFKFSPTTLVGFNYRSITTYQLSGKSVYEGFQRVVSNKYHFKLWTPARSVFSISHYVTPNLGFITTINRIQWSAIKTIHVYGIANLLGRTPVIINGSVPHYLRDTWLVTLGSQYRMTPEWIFRVAGSYAQSPGNPHYQITNGDSIVLGASMSYVINKTITIDGSYAHAFIRDESIDTQGKRYEIRGINEGSRDAVSVKLRFSLST